MPFQIARPLVAAAMLALAPLLAAREPMPPVDAPASPPAAQVASAAASAEPGAGTIERTLPNGMKVLVREDRRAPTVVHLVLYRIGAVDELNGLTGISHVLEHMMFKGCLLYTSPSPRDKRQSRMPSSA